MRFDMRFIKLHSLLLIAFAFFPITYLTAQKKSSGSINVFKTSQTPTPLNNSLIYSLPKTVIKVEIETEKTIRKTGPYYRYSERFLNLSNVITEDEERWTITGVKVTTDGIPDPDQRYFVKTTGETTASLMSLTPSGILKGINLPSECCKHPKQKLVKIADDIKLEDVNFDDISYNQDLLMKTSTAAMAQEAANMIYQIRTNRNNILSGDAENLPPDGEAYKTVLEQLDKEEKEFMSLFAGKTITIKHTQTFEVTPDPLSSYNNYVICRFSPQKGLLDQMDITGTPVYFNLEDMKNISLSNTITEDDKHVENRGFFFNLPGEVHISIKDKTTEIYNTKISVAQYGKTAYLPASLVEKGNVSIEFDSATGALLQISK